MLDAAILVPCTPQEAETIARRLWSAGIFRHITIATELAVDRISDGENNNITAREIRRLLGLEESPE
jgi:hypothetical protein